MRRDSRFHGNDKIVIRRHSLSYGENRHLKNYRCGDPRFLKQALETRRYELRAMGFFTTFVEGPVGVRMRMKADAIARPRAHSNVRRRPAKPLAKKVGQDPTLQSRQPKS